MDTVLTTDQATQQNVSVPLAPQVTPPSVSTPPSDPPSKKGFSVKQLVTGFLIALVLGGGLFGGMNLISMNQERRGKAAGSDVRLTFAAPATATVGTPFDVQVYINGSESNYEVTAASVSAQFNTNDLTLVSVTPGPFFTSYNLPLQLAKVFNNIANIATGIYGVPCEDNPTPSPSDCHTQVLGTGAAVHLMTFRFQPKSGAASSTTIQTHVPSTQLAAKNQDATNVFQASTAPSVTISISGGTGVTNTPTHSPTATLTPTATTTPTLTPTDAPGTIQVNLRMKFYGAVAGVITLPNQKADIVIKNATGTRYEFADASIVAGSDGVFTGAVHNVIPGTYDIYIKGWAHLRTKFTGIALTTDNQAVDLTSVEMIAGDTQGALDPQGQPTGDNRISIVDYAKLSDEYGTAGTNTDLNLTGRVSIVDFGIISDNYGAQGDNE